MKKILKWVILVGVVLVILNLVGILQFRWLKADMGWCQKYGVGLKIGDTVIFDLQKYQTSICV